jgi:hypothetical protein
MPEERSYLKDPEVDNNKMLKFILKKYRGRPKESDKMRIFVNAVLNIWVAYHRGHFLSS